ncbi:MAG: cytochrome c family protein [Rhodobacteraceae bacterium]|nr:cytochrome c family protein [Paracoccaceae bacterium]
MKTVNIATIATLVAALAAPVLAEGDAKKGEKVFKKCKACHMVGEDAKNKIGPVLNGIVDSEAAQNPDFKYSSAMIEAAEDGLVWDEENLGAFLTKPKDFMKKNKMSFAGLRKESDVENIIAYLRSVE